MWTEAHRGRYHPKLKKAVSERMVVVLAAWVELVDRPTSPRATPTIAVAAAVAHHLRTGGAWRDLPSWFPNWRTAYGWFRRWTAMGLFDEAMRHVARLRREARGRVRPPNLTAIHRIAASQDLDPHGGLDQRRQSRPGRAASDHQRSLDCRTTR